MKLFLVRHGETEENAAGILMGQLPGVLTEKGKRQAEELAQTLKNYRFAHIYSSDLARSIDTAEYIKALHPDTPFTLTQNLRERNLGTFQGRLSKSIDWDSLPGEGDDKRPPEGETVSELRTRALNFAQQLYRQHSNESVLLISHEGWIKHLVSLLTRTPSKDVPKIENARPVEMDVDENLVGKVLNG